MGRATMHVNGISGNTTYTISSPSKTATVTVYIQKGPKSAGSDVAGLSTLHFWLSSGVETINSYVAFEDKDAGYTTTECKDGVFRIIAKASKESEQVGYTLKVSSEK